MTAATTRERLIEAALGELEDKGYEAIRVDEIARRAGLTTGAIYGAFGTKHGLLAAALTTRDAEAFDAALAADESAARRGKDERLVFRIVAGNPGPFREAAARLSSAGASAPTSAAGAQSTRQRLMAAALAVLDDDGYRGATIGEIARRAGLTTGAIYANFGSKQELLHAAMASRYEALFQAVLDESVTGPGGVGTALAGFLTRPPSAEHTALVELVAAAARDSEVRRSLRKELVRRRAVLSTTLDERLAEAGEPPTVDELAALAFVVQTLALGSVVAQSVGLPAPPPEQLAALFARWVADADVSAPDVSARGSR